MALQDGGFDSDPRVAQILAIVAKEAAIDRAKLKQDATIEELGIDLLDLTMTVFQLETTFDITIPAMTEQAGAEFATVGDLVRHVIAAMEKAAPNGAAANRGAPNGATPHGAALHGTTPTGSAPNGVAPNDDREAAGTTEPASEVSGGTK